MTDTAESKVAERLARIEAGMQTLLAQTEHISRLTESVTRMQERSQQHDSSIGILFKRISETDRNNLETKEKLDKWINRGVGAYAAASILVGVIAFLLFRVVGEYEGRIRNAGDTLVTVDRRLAWVEFELRGRKGAAHDDGVR